MASTLPVPLHRPCHAVASLRPVHEEFVKAWEARWPIELLATPYELKRRFPDQWVRFHCLPESKRYAESESEYAIVLDRYNTILGELYSETEIYIVNVEYDSEPVPSGPKQKWWTVMRDEDPEFGPTYAHLSLRRDLWQRGMIDTELRRVADDQDSGGVVTDSGAYWLFHPYDGGMDVIAPTTRDRDRLRDRHRDWLSKHPFGL